MHENGDFEGGCVVRNARLRKERVCGKAKGYGDGDRGIEDEEGNEPGCEY